MMRRSSSIARTLAVPALKIACESARMTLFMICASSPLERSTVGRNRFPFSHGPGAAKHRTVLFLPHFGYRQTPQKTSGKLPLDPVEIIHRTFVTPVAQGYLHLSNTPQFRVQPKCLNVTRNYRGLPDEPVYRFGTRWM